MRYRNHTSTIVHSGNTRQLDDVLPDLAADNPGPRWPAVHELARDHAAAPGVRGLLALRMLDDDQFVGAAAGKALDSVTFEQSWSGTDPDSVALMREPSVVHQLVRVVQTASPPPDTFQPYVRQPMQPHQVFDLRRACGPVPVNS